MRNLNAFDLFFRRALNLASFNVGVLIPRNGANRNDYTDMRKKIIENTWILNIYDWKLFPGVTQECISVIVSDRKSDKPDKVIINNLQMFTQESIGPPLYIFNIHSSMEQYNLKEKIKLNSKKGLLRIICEIKRGEETCLSAALHTSSAGGCMFLKQSSSMMICQRY